MLLTLLSVTYKFPASSRTTPLGRPSPVLVPLTVRTGGTLPVPRAGSTRRKHQNAVGIEVRHEKVVGAVQRNACRAVAPGAGAADGARGEPVAARAWRKYQDAGVARRCHIDVACAVERDGDWPVDLGVKGAGESPDGGYVTACARRVHRDAARVRHVETRDIGRKRRDRQDCFSGIRRPSRGHCERQGGGTLAGRTGQRRRGAITAGWDGIEYSHPGGPGTRGPRARLCGLHHLSEARTR